MPKKIEPKKEFRKMPEKEVVARRKEATLRRLATQVRKRFPAKKVGANFVFLRNYALQGKGTEKQVQSSIKFLGEYSKQLDSLFMSAVRTEQSNLKARRKTEGVQRMIIELVSENTGIKSLIQRAKQKRGN
jgi:hypothetical protein